jgi:hypothetical protein
MSLRSASSILLLFSELLLASTGAANAAWSCTGQWEVTCGEDGCAPADEGGFTPVSVSTNSAGELEFCAYSGCWSGPVSSTHIAGRYETIVGTGLAWSQEGGSPEDVLVSIDRTSGYGVILSAGFVSPLKCEMSAGD